MMVIRGPSVAVFPAGADAVCPVFRDLVVGSGRLPGDLGDVSAASLPREVAWRNARVCKVMALMALLSSFGQWHGAQCQVCTTRCREEDFGRVKRNMRENEAFAATVVTVKVKGEGK